MPEKFNAQKIKETLKSLTIKTIEDGKLEPVLALVRLGAGNSEKYSEEEIRKACSECGIKVWSLELPGYLDQYTLAQAVKQLSIDPKISGIKVICPKQYDLGLIGAAISKEKDVDGFTFLEGGAYAPCEIASVVALIDYSDISCESKNIAVISDKQIDADNMTKMLSHRFATIQVYKPEQFQLSKVKVLPDIIISLSQKEIKIPDQFINEETVIIDASIIVAKDLTVKGSIENNFDDLSFKSLVPGGIDIIYPYIMALHISKMAETQQK